MLYLFFHSIKASFGFAIWINRKTGAFIPCKMTKLIQILVFCKYYVKLGIARYLLESLEVIVTITSPKPRQIGLNIMQCRVKSGYNSPLFSSSVGLFY